jgi:hypothetical protein
MTVRLRTYDCSVDRSSFAIWVRLSNTKKVEWKNESVENKEGEEEEDEKGEEKFNECILLVSSSGVGSSTGSGGGGVSSFLGTALEPAAGLSGTLPTDPE